MEAYKREFIEFMVDAEVLTFGDFVTKSGRKTPYFVNTGRYRTGAQVEALGRFYASAIQASLPDDAVDVLFGPAYKGIPLVVTTAIALQNAHSRDLSFCFNRKEAKDHGEGGSLVGHLPQDGERVLIVEDVTTAGTSIRETVPILRSQAEVQLAGLIVSVDRQERGPGGGSALAEVGAEFGMPTLSIVTLDDIVEHLTGREVNGALILTPDILERIEAYRAEYGA
ncbi:MAG TPA: orotate phosphoribosyltransferase [Planctomycetes bacterium]|nr:orotate phosphoribosyltransferase [Planctomycetota bacterium]HIK59414.1 orotate phosphoribosyltransferase [Planctomycetota bacterium]